MQKKTAIIYARQSSGKEEASASIEMQIERCKDFARNRKIEVTNIFSDHNTSGRLYPTGAEDFMKSDYVIKEWIKEHNYEKLSRPGLGAVVSNIHSVDYVIFYDMTRLYRPLQGSYLQNYIDMQFRKSNTKMLSIKEGEIDINDSSEHLIRNIRSDINDTQMKITNDKSKQALKKLRNSGIIPTCPKMFGIEYIGGKDKTVQVNPKAAEVIRFVYKRIIALDSYNSIIRKLNERYMDLTAGNGFYSTSLRHMAAQPFYCGYMYDTDNTLIKARQMEGKAIVTLEEWQKVQEIMHRKRREPQGRNQSINPFSHILYCGECGAKMIIGTDGNKKFYHCYHGANDLRNEKCKKSRVTINLVRQTANFTGLREAISPILALALYKDLENADLTLTDVKKLASMKQKLAVYSDRKSKLSAKYAEGELDVDSFTGAATELNKKIGFLKNEIFKIENAVNNKDFVVDTVNKHFKNIENVVNNRLDDAIFEDLLHKAVKRINCFYDYIEVETPYGNFTLKKYMLGRYRNFPRFTYSFHGIKGNKEDYSKTQMIVTYDYTGADNKEKNQLIVDFNVMKISSCNRDETV